MKKTHHILIIGSGPAGLMCAQKLSKLNSYKITVCDQYPFLGYKLLVAGKTGLNISNTFSQKEFINKLTGPKKHFENILNNFSQKDWVKLVNYLGISTYQGSSEKTLIKETASKFIKTWVKQLTQNKVSFLPNHTFKNFNHQKNQIIVSFKEQQNINCDFLCLALGGQSYLKKPSDWVVLLKAKGVVFSSFKPSNVGYHVDWPKDFIKEACGLPLKNIELKTENNKIKGELTITKYGLEGSPIYHLGQKGIAHIDLKPDLTKQNILEKIKNNPKNLSAYRLACKKLNLALTKKALLFHLTTEEEKKSKTKLCDKIKNFPITLTKSRPINEAISTAGGIRFNNLDSFLMLKKHPNVYLMGEMLDWDAPTGGFLIQTCVSQGAWVGKAISLTIPSCI